MSFSLAPTAFPARLELQHVHQAHHAMLAIGLAHSSNGGPAHRQHSPSTTLARAVHW